MSLSDSVESTDPRVRRFEGIHYASGKPFNVSYMTEVAHNLWQGGCTAGLVLPMDIKHVVSLHVDERYTYQHDLMSEMYVSMEDSPDQHFDQVRTLADWVNCCRATGPTLVHCQGGLNRSSLITTRALYISDTHGDQHFTDGATIIGHLRNIRSPLVLCNPAFEAEVRSWT